MSYVDIATWGIPQLVYIILTFIGFGFICANHGKPRQDNYSIWNSLFSTSIIMIILYYGRFFG